MQINCRYWVDRVNEGERNRDWENNRDSDCLLNNLRLNERKVEHQCTGKKDLEANGVGQKADTGKGRTMAT